MRKFIHQKLKEQKGLTLIELLAVIVILAIIAAIAIPAIGNIIQNSRVGAIKSDALNAIAASEIYFAENTGTTVTLTQLKTGGYIDDAGSFDTTAGSSTDITAITKTTSTQPAQFSGKGTVGSVSITISTKTKAQISGLSNSTPAIATGGFIVVR
jgi:type IV pilus assembly protein PilA